MKERIIVVIVIDRFLIIFLGKFIIKFIIFEGLNIVKYDIIVEDYFFFNYKILVCDSWFIYLKVYDVLFFVNDL